VEDRETPRMRKCGESRTTRIMMATVPHVTSCSGLTKISGRWIFVRQSVRNESHCTDQSDRLRMALNVNVTKYGLL